MSQIRRNHPGYYGVTMALAVPWYVGNGLVFSFGDRHLTAHNSIFHFVFHYVSGPVWGVAYVLLGVALAVSATVPLVPHIYVRVCCSLGWMLTVFFLLMFVTSDLAGGPVTTLLIPGWLTVCLVEFRAMIESEQNPAMLRRRA